MPTLVGTDSKGKQLEYCEDLFEFRLGGHYVEAAHVRALDARGHVHWHFLEHRDWFRKLDLPALAAANERALREAGLSHETALQGNPEAQIAEHVRRDKSYLMGRIVDTDNTPRPGETQAQFEERVAAEEAADQLNAARLDMSRYTKREQRKLKRALRKDAKAKAAHEKAVEAKEKRAAQAEAAMAATGASVAPGEIGKRLAAKVPRLGRAVEATEKAQQRVYQDSEEAPEKFAEADAAIEEIMARRRSTASTLQKLLEPDSRRSIKDLQTRSSTAPFGGSGK